MFICTMYTVSFCLPFFRKCALKIYLLEAVRSVHGIDEVKAKNLLQFAQQSDKRTQTRYFLFTKRSEKRENITVASLIYV